MAIADEIAKLDLLRKSGALTEEEFAAQKARVLKGAGLQRDPRYSSLYCSEDDKMVLGLAGGLAHKFNIPSPAMRFVLFLSMWFGVGFLVYLVGLFLPALPTAKGNTSL